MKNWEGWKALLQLNARKSEKEKAGAAWQEWHTPSISAPGRQSLANVRVQNQPGLRSQFQDSQGYTGFMKLCLIKQKQKKFEHCLLNGFTNPIMDLLN